MALNVNINIDFLMFGKKSDSRPRKWLSISISNVAFSHPNLGQVVEAPIAMNQH